MNRILDYIKSLPATLWGVVLIVVAVLFGLFEKSKAEDADAKLEVADEEKKDVELVGRENVVETKIEETKKEGEAEKEKKLSPEELAKETSKV